MNVKVGAKTDVGRVRDGNEDAYFVDQPLFAVADGMGGHLAGDVASRTAVEVIAACAGEARSDPALLAEVVRRANSSIYAKADGDAALRGMGTTCTMMLVADDEVHFAHVGDSRAYLFRDGELSQLTQDHTLVERMVQEGRIRAEDADRHPQRSIITRALGIEDQVDVDTFSVEMREGDRFLLCSDGLTSMVASNDIGRVLGSTTDPQDASEQLIDLANRAGGEDNITVVVVDLTGESHPPASATAEAIAASSERERQATEPDVLDAEPRSHIVVAPARRSFVPRLLAAVALIALLLVAAVGALRFVLTNSWFVGLNDDGEVAIFQGRPETIGGVSLVREEHPSGIDGSSLPSFVQDDLRAGIPAESLDDARAKVANLRELARDEEFRRSPAGETNTGTDG